MTLAQWIETTGPKIVSKTLRVDPSAVSAWRNGHSCPRPKYLVRINAMSKGRVKIDSVIRQFANKRR